VEGHDFGRAERIGQTPGFAPRVRRAIRSRSRASRFSPMTPS